MFSSLIFRRSGARLARGAESVFLYFFLLKIHPVDTRSLCSVNALRRCIDLYKRDAQREIFFLLYSRKQPAHF